MIENYGEVCALELTERLFFPLAVVRVCRARFCPQPVVNKEEPGRVVMVTASKTRQVDRFLNQELGGGIEVETRSLHRAVSSAKHHFINQGSSDKLELLEQTILPHARGKNHGLVFCNTLDSCRCAHTPPHFHTHAHTHTLTLTPPPSLFLFCGAFRTSKLIFDSFLVFQK